jgi:hypothetical protein
VHGPRVTDLLAHEAQFNKALHVRAIGDDAVVEDLSKHRVTSEAALQLLWKRAELRRKSVETRLNQLSSRSHAILTFWVTTSQPVGC